MVASWMETWRVCCALRSALKLISRRHSTTVSASSCEAWYRSSNSEERMLLKTTPRPYLNKSDSVLVKVHAASVNPIDVRMSEGYGSAILGLYNIFDSAAGGKSAPELPDILGRDFSGTITAVGPSVDKYRPGDEVFGALKAIDSGTHSEFLVTDVDSIAHKPSNLTHVQAAAVPYALLTFLSAVDPLNCANLRHQHVFLNGGAGGITSLTMQYLKALDCEVTVSCSIEGRGLVESLNPHHMLDYQSEDFRDNLLKLSGFDIGFDCVGDETVIPYIKPGGRYVTVVSPLLADADKYGLLGGATTSLSKLANKMQSAWFNHGVIYHWGYFMPNGARLEEIKALIESEQIKPIIDEVFPFSELPAAYEKVSKGKGRGKTVIEMPSA